MHEVEGASRKMEKKAIEFYVRSLHSKALAGLYQNHVIGEKLMLFQRRNTFLKFFKRKWLAKTRARLLFKRIVFRAVDSYQTTGKSR